MTSPMRAADDRIVAVAASVVTRLAVRFLVGKYALMGGLMRAGLAGFATFLGCFALRGVDGVHLAIAALGVGTAFVQGVLVLQDCGRRDAASSGARFVDADAATAAFARSRLMPFRIVFATLCVAIACVAVAFRAHLPADAWSLCAGVAMFVLAEYVRCVPFVPVGRPAPLREVKVAGVLA